MKYVMLFLFVFIISNFVNAQKIVLAQVEINQQNDNTFFTLTKNLIILTRAEKGCVDFSINIKSKNPNELVIFEIFADDNAFKNHLKQPYVIEWFKMLNKLRKTELSVIELKTLN